MKNVLKLIATATLCLMLSGCENAQTIYYNKDYSGEAIRVDEGIYFKKVYIQGMYVLLQCDKDGNITHNQNVNSGYQQGKVFVNTTVLTPSSDFVDKESKFNFKCTEITDCYNQVLIVKNSLVK